MKIAIYIGDHKNDSLLVRLGAELTRMTQKGKYSDVTHGEAILKEHADGTVDIGSATLRKETEAGKAGVRIKERVRLKRGHWMIIDVPKFDAKKSLAWHIEHEGDGYDLRGAVASILPIWWSTKNRYFCYQAIAESVGMENGEALTGSLFAAMCLFFGKDVTTEFFNAREMTE